MDFAGAIKSGFVNYANFRGVASRAEYWYWLLFTVLVNIAVSFIDTFDQTGLISMIVSIGLLIPTLSVLFRRLRDAGHTSLWFWGALLSGIVFIILLFVFLFSLLGAGLSDQFMANPELITQEAVQSWFANSTVATSFILLLISGVVSGIMNIVVNIIFCIHPTKTAEQGNKYVLPQNPMN